MSSLKKLVVSSILMAGLASSFVNPCCAVKNKSLVCLEGKKQKSKEKDNKNFQKTDKLKLEKKKVELENGLLKSLPEEKYSFLNTVKQKLEPIKNLSEKQILKILVAASGLASSLVVANYILRKTNIFGNKITEQVTKEELQNKTSEENMNDKNSKIQGIKSKDAGKNDVKGEDSTATSQGTTSNENIKNQETKSESIEKNDVKSEESSATKNMQPSKENNNEDVTENRGGEKSNNKPLGFRRAESTLLCYGLFMVIYLYGVVVAALVESEIRNEKKVTSWIALSWFDVIGRSVTKLVANN